MEFKPSKAWQDTSNAVTTVLNITYKAHKDAEPKRKYLGGSMIGRDCEREIAYQYHQTPIEGEGFSGQLYRIFDRGHASEERMAKYLRIAGFDLVTHKADGSQFGWGAMDGKIRGHIDGALRGGPPIPGIDWNKPALWETKCVNNATFGKFWNHGLYKTKPVYAVQVALYCAYMGLEQTLFTAENADTCEVFAEAVPFDAVLAQQKSDLAVRIVQSRTPEELPRVAAAPDDFRCKFCDFAVRCWTKPAVLAAPVATPSWLAKC